MRYARPIPVINKQGIAASSSPECDADFVEIRKIIPQSSKRWHKEHEDGQMDCGSRCTASDNGIKRSFITNRSQVRSMEMKLCLRGDLAREAVRCKPITRLQKL